MVPLLEVLARFQLPWWCFARADALLNLSEPLLGAGARAAACAWPTSAPSRPATGCCTTCARARSSDQTLAAVELCRRHGVVPELSFMLAPPQDPEGETERTFEFIRHIKRATRAPRSCCTSTRRCRRAPALTRRRPSARGRPARLRTGQR